MRTWEDIIGEENGKGYWLELERFLQEESKENVIYPKSKDIYRAFSLCPLHKTRVVILGQDPYHGPKQATGLAFSINPKSESMPPSLVNILTELKEDLGYEAEMGDLSKWAKQGVLLLNTALTVSHGSPGSHLEYWTPFTERIIAECVERKCFFILWGRKAERMYFKALNTNNLNDIPLYFIVSSHPSPYSARAKAPQPFLGSRPFSAANLVLATIDPNKKGINWNLT